MEKVKRSRPRRRLERKCETWFPLHRPVLLAALGLAGWAPTGAAQFPPTLDLSTLDGSNGFTLNGVAEEDFSGFSVSNAGDVNGDGLDDLLIGAYGAGPGGSGETYVVFGRDTAQSGPFSASLDLSSLNGTNGFRLAGVAPGDGAGNEVSSAGDVNGDGVADVLIGAYRASPNGFHSGASYVVFGRNTAQSGPFPASLSLSTLDGTNGFTLNGFAAFDDSGRAVSSAGDVNGDTIDDVIIGAFAADPNGVNLAGASYVVFGRNTPFPASLDLSALDGTNGFRLAGATTNDYSGFAVSNAGDVNGDTIDDLLIGAYGAGPSGSGESYVVFGRNTAQSGLFPASINLSSLDGNNGFRLAGVAGGDGAGSEVSSAGDVNGDGVADVLIGAFRANPNGNNSGTSYVVFGRNTAQSGPFPASLNLSSLNGTNGFTLNGVAAYDAAGAAVSGAGDVDADGIDDLLIGAHGADPNGANNAGASYVVFGQATPFPASLNLSTLNGTIGFRLNGVAANDESGRAVSNAGDVNGDGGADFLIGAFLADPNGVNRAGASYVVFGVPPPPAPPPPPPLPPGTCNSLPVTLQGTDNGETLIGTPGNDVIDAQGGNDVLRGLGGNDVLCGGAGRDRLLGGSGRDRLLGGAGRDRLRGAAGRDALNGGRGLDQCDGGAGTDTARRCEIQVRVP